MDASSIDKMSFTMARFKWKFPQVLKENGLGPYDIAKKINDIGRAPTVYRLAKDETADSLTRVDLKMLGDLTKVLRELTDKEITANDLLEYDPDD